MPGKSDRVISPPAHAPMVTLDAFVDGLKVAATSPYAYASYVLLLACWTFLAARGQRLRVVRSVLKDLPEHQRFEILKREFPEFPRSGLSPEQWIRARAHAMILIAFVALLLSGTVISVISMTSPSSKKIADLTSQTDWQMFLTLVKANVAVNGKEAIPYQCVDEKTGHVGVPRPVSVRRGEPLLVAVLVNLVVDNAYSKNRGLIYPVGLTTTWDRTSYLIYDGRDAEQWRISYGPKLVRDFVQSVALTAPKTAGIHYIVIMAGAALSVDQVFHGNTEAAENANSLWNLPYSRFAGHACGGYIDRPFIHASGRQEHVLWPMIAIPVQVR